MKISELVGFLQKCEAEHGDLDVTLPFADEDNNFAAEVVEAFYVIEFKDRDGEANQCIVLMTESDMEEFSLGSAVPPGSTH